MIGHSDSTIPFPKAHRTPKPQEPYVCRKPFKQVFRFKITLQEVEPVVWRRIELPYCYTFWDLHVAITDVFGWLDYHLHEFKILNSKTGKPERYGSRGEEFDELDDLPPLKSDRKKKLAGLFHEKCREAAYCYDFGDCWEHTIELEDILLKDQMAGYPRCTAGEMACPPDDCGGAAGYERLLSAIRNPRDSEHKHMVNWLRGMKGDNFKPDVFDPAAVHFDNPDIRWKVAYEGGKMTPDMRGWEFVKRQEGRE